MAEPTPPAQLEGGAMSDLSPAAQAVLDAVENHGAFSYRKLAAAALRAAADRVEPDDGVSAEVRQVLNKLLAIAAELRGGQADG